MKNTSIVPYAVFFGLATFAFANVGLGVSSIFAGYLTTLIGAMVWFKFGPSGKADVVQTKTTKTVRKSTAPVRDICYDYWLVIQLVNQLKLTYGKDNGGGIHIYKYKDFEIFGVSQSGLYVYRLTSNSWGSPVTNIEIAYNLLAKQIGVIDNLYAMVESKQKQNNQNQQNQNKQQNQNNNNSGNNQNQNKQGNNQQNNQGNNKQNNQANQTQTVPAVQSNNP